MWCYSTEATKDYLDQTEIKRVGIYRLKKNIWILGKIKSQNGMSSNMKSIPDPKSRTLAR